jgi:hypothetical protein
MDHYEAEAFLREKFLSRITGHSVQTRHAYDHLIHELKYFRLFDYGHRPNYPLPSFVTEHQPDEEISLAA